MQSGLKVQNPCIEIVILTSILIFPHTTKKEKKKYVTV